MSLWDEDGKHFSSARSLKLAYHPPKSDLPGLAVAGSLLVCWVRRAATRAQDQHCRPEGGARGLRQASARVQATGGLW
jgi:hypothetical protein